MDNITETFHNGRRGCSHVDVAAVFERKAGKLVENTAAFGFFKAPAFRNDVLDSK